jgi:hypothetical protein
LRTTGGENDGGNFVHTLDGGDLSPLWPLGGLTPMSSVSLNGRGRDKRRQVTAPQIKSRYAKPQEREAYIVVPSACASS